MIEMFSPSGESLSALRCINLKPKAVKDMLYMVKSDEGYLVLRQVAHTEDYILITSSECGSYLTVEEKTSDRVLVSIRPEFKKLIEGMFENSPKKVSKELWDLEKEIMKAFDNKPHFPLFPEGDTDAYQEKLEWQWHTQDLDRQYQDCQKRLHKAFRHKDRKIYSASEHYRRQKEFDETVASYKKHHINGF